jgi:hypothetical protein
MIKSLFRFLALLRLRLRAGIAIVVLFLLGSASLLLSGDPDYDLKAIIVGAFRLSALLLWIWLSGWILDLANGVNFAKDREAIEGGNLALAVNRSVGYAALVIAGAMLIAQV